MDIIKKRRVVPDHWRHELGTTGERSTAEIAPGDIIVGLERWLNDWEALLARGSRVGVRIGAADDVSELAGAQRQELWLVEFHFESFADGRAYSQARLLRSRHDFHGAIRASGDVSRDRLSFMERCGFDEFQLPAADDPDTALAFFHEFTMSYQPDAGPEGPGDEIVAQRRGYRFAPSVSSAA